LFGGLTADEVRQLATVLSKLTSRSERTAAILDTHYKLKHGDNGEN
jgi:hypothetical protein